MHYGGANVWGGVTVDEQRGWVFAAPGSAAGEFIYGGSRKGDNLFANTVLALNARTGERIWHYQIIRHDIWDYDLPPAPILATITTKNGTRDVVVQLTKMGLTFVLDRDTGKPVFPVVDLPVPPSTVPGEQASATQPFPLLPQPLTRLQMHESDITDITPKARAHVLKRFRQHAVRLSLHSRDLGRCRDHARPSRRRRMARRRLRSDHQRPVRERERAADDPLAAAPRSGQPVRRPDSGAARRAHLRHELHGLPRPQPYRKPALVAAADRRQAEPCRDPRGADERTRHDAVVLAAVRGGDERRHRVLAERSISGAGGAADRSQNWRPNLVWRHGTVGVVDDHAAVRQHGAVLCRRPRVSGHQAAMGHAQCPGSGDRTPAVESPAR